MSNNSPINADIADSKLVSKFLEFVATGLLLIFLVSVLVDTFPFQPLKPTWLFSFCNRLIGSGIIALLSFCLLHIATLFNPGNHFLKHRLVRTRQWGIAAVIGFLLLIPLQGYATWKLFSEAKQTQQAGLAAANQRFSPIKQAINEATSINDLQARLQKRSLGIRLQEQQLTQPLSELKKSLIFELDRAQIQISDRLAGPKPEQIWAAVQANTRVVVSSLGYALAFAAGAQAKGSSYTLLESFSERWASLTGQSRRRNQRPSFPQE